MKKGTLRKNISFLFTTLMLVSCMPNPASVPSEVTEGTNSAANNAPTNPVTPGTTASGLLTLAITTAAPASSSELMRTDAFGNVPLRRLTKIEVLNSVTDILGIDPTSIASTLPEDMVEESINPFNNDSSLQSVSSTAVEEYYDFAEKYAALALSNTTKINTFAGCTPSKVDDSVCFKQFATKIGRLFFRRPLTTTEINTYSTTFIARALATNNYHTATSLLLNYLVLNPEFLYRVEVGQAVAGSSQRELNDYEIASRLSYLIWGSAPDSVLLDAAAAGQLKSETIRVREATRMLVDAKAKPQWQSFHAQWLGYADVDLPTNIASDMTQETNMLVNKIALGNGGNWLDIFTYDQTYVTPSLASHYGFSPITMSDWVSYPNKKGAGLLSHGKFLVQGSKFGDTSPTLRGYRILKRVLCQKLGSIPLGVDTDNPPGGTSGGCKNTTYNMRKLSSCQGCHILTDNIGFGLENYSPTGQWRDTEPGRPSCSIASEGAVGEDGYKGIDELGESLANHPAAIQCASRQLLRFALGRTETSSDLRTIQALHGQYLETPQFKSMIFALVKSPAFSHL